MLPSSASYLRVLLVLFYAVIVCPFLKILHSAEWIFHSRSADLEDPTYSPHERFWKSAAMSHWNFAESDTPIRVTRQVHFDETEYSGTFISGEEWSYMRHNTG